MIKRSYNPNNTNWISEDGFLRGYITNPGTKDAELHLTKLSQEILSVENQRSIERQLVNEN